MIQYGSRRPTASGIVSVPGILFLAFLLRAAWCLIVPTQPVSDFLAYHAGAASIATGLGYTTASGQPTAYLPVGYSALLAGIYVLFGTSVAAAKMMNILLSTLTIWICYRLFDRLSARQGRGGAHP